MFKHPFKKAVMLTPFHWEHVNVKERQGISRETEKVHGTWPGPQEKQLSTLRVRLPETLRESETKTALTKKK